MEAELLRRIEEAHRQVSESINRVPNQLETEADPVLKERVEASLIKEQTRSVNQFFSWIRDIAHEREAVEELPGLPPIGANKLNGFEITPSTFDELRSGFDDKSNSLLKILREAANSED